MIRHYAATAIDVLPATVGAGSPSPAPADAANHPFVLAYANQQHFELRNAWDEQRDKWLRAKGSSDCTRRAYETATSLFRTHCGLDWWLVTADHVRAWQTAMTDAGLAPATIRQRLAAVSSFYSWVIREQKLDSRGNESSLFTDAQGRTRQNPFLAHNIERPTLPKTGVSRAIGPDVLAHILDDIDTATLEGARDAALLKTFLLTGWRCSECLSLKWSAIRPNDRRSGEFICAWSGKGDKSQDDAFPAACYDAIVAYLKRAGRWLPGHPADIQPGDYIWQPIRDHGTHNFPNAAAAGLGQNRHISATQANNILRKRLRNALRKTGLTLEAAAASAATYHIHNLRHTFAHNMRKARFDVVAISQRLHHENIATTQRYLDSLEAPIDDYSQALQLAMGI
jgi:site-specific recombinase XerD